MEQQQPLVSVIIPEFDDDTYLIRCINSIRRQTYKNVEIILIRDFMPQNLKNILNLKTIYYGNYWENINMAIAQASGSAVLFCHTNTVLENQLLEKLVAFNNTETFSFARCLKTDGKNFDNITCNELTLYGKLFYLKFITDKTKCFDSEECFPELSFLCSYAHSFIKINIVENGYIYGESEDIYNFIPNNVASFSRVENGFSLLNNDNLIDRQAIFYLVEHAPESISREEWIKLAVKIDNQFHNYRLNYFIADNYLSEIFTICLNENDSCLFEKFKEYFSSFQKDERFMKVICPLFGMKEKEIDFLLSCSLDEYLFYEEHDFIEDTMTDSDNYTPFEKKINILIEEIKKIESMVKASSKADVVEKHNSPGVVMDIQDQNSSLILLSGPDLAEYVISQYRQGKLGIKTIFKSIKAWIKYKF